MAHNTRGQAPPSYIDGISVKISERYKPPKRIAVALSYSQRLTLNKLMHDPLPSYDFKLEASVKSRVNEWRKARSQICDDRNLRLCQMQAEKSAKSDEIVENREVLSDNETKLSSNNYYSESGVLIPITVNSQLSANASDHLSYQMNKVFNFSEFESDTSSPFDNMELKTINDLEELAEVLIRDSVNTKLINDAHLTNKDEPATLNSYSQNVKIHNTSYPTNSSESQTIPVSSYFSNSSFSSANSDLSNTPAVNSFNSSYKNPSSSPTFNAIESTFSNAYTQNAKNYDNSPSKFSGLDSFPNNSYNQSMKNPNNDNSPPRFNALESFSNNYSQNVKPNSVDSNISFHSNNSALESFSNNKDIIANTFSYNNQTMKAFPYNPPKSFNPNQSVLDHPYPSYNPQTYFDSKEGNKINGYYYPNSSHFVSRGYDPVDLKSEQMSDPSVRSVNEIMKALRAELGQTQSPVTVSGVANSSSPPKQLDGLENPFVTLSNDLQEMALKISGMGFPLARVARACVAMDGNQKKIVEHLLVMAELLDLGFTELNVVGALLKSDNDRDKALDLLIT